MEDVVDVAARYRAERTALEKDYVAFSKAYDLIRTRISESLEEARAPQLHEWSGTSAVCGALELSINAIRRTIDEYDKVIKQVEAGVLVPEDLPPERKPS